MKGDDSMFSFLFGGLFGGSCEYVNPVDIGFHGIGFHGEGDRAATCDEIDKHWRLMMRDSRAETKGNEMKEDTEKVVDIKSRNIPEDIASLPGDVYDDILKATVDDEEVKSLWKRAVSLFFKKLGEIITAIFGRIMGILGVKR